MVFFTRKIKKRILLSERRKMMGKKRRKRKTKQAAIILFTMLLIIAGGTAVFKISKKEKGDAQPAKQYQEKKQEIAEQEETQDVEDEKKEDAEEKNSIMISPLKVEVLSYEVIDDSEIGGQTTYAAKYFYENKLPDPEKYEEETDMEACKAECPELKDIWENNGKYTVQEVKDIYQEHIDVIQKYTTSVYVPRHFVFVKCRIANTSGRHSKVLLNGMDVCSSSKDNNVFNSFISDTMVYFDNPIHTEGEERENSYFEYSFKPDEVLECILGFEVKDQVEGQEIENPDYYLGVVDVQMQEEHIHPSYSNRFIKLNDVAGE